MPRPILDHDEYLKRFHERSRMTETGCIEWTGTCHKTEGYGSFCYQGRTVLAHRFAWELRNGPIPKGAQIHHTCKNPACVNPDHLQAVTGKEHVRLDDTPAGRNAAKTHCPQGHPYDEENTNPSAGRRKCRTCHREKWREKQGGRELATYNGQKTHCPQGHPYDEENTLWTRDGRACRTCIRERSREWHRRKAREKR